MLPLQRRSRRDGNSRCPPQGRENHALGGTTRDIPEHHPKRNHHQPLPLVSTCLQEWGPPRQGNCLRSRDYFDIEKVTVVEESLLPSNFLVEICTRTCAEISKSPNSHCHDQSSGFRLRSYASGRGERCDDPPR